MFQDLNTINTTSKSLREELFVPNKILKTLFNLMIVFAVCFVSYNLCFQVILKPITVAGYSMQPSINQFAKGDLGQYYTDTVYYSKYNLQNINRNDVIIVNSNYTPNNHSLIKRVIAVPGDEITFKRINGSGHLIDGNIFYYYDAYVNGVLLNELDGSLGYTIKGKMEFEPHSYTSSEYYTFYNTLTNSLTETGVFSYTLSSNEYFIMGDNRNNSTDSRWFGPVKFADIEGKVLIFVPYGSNLAKQLWNMLLT